MTTHLPEEAGYAGSHTVPAPNNRRRALAKKHLQNGHLVLYDITSSYLEGEYEASEIVGFGYNRDGKRGHEQVVIGLICNEQGCPVGVEVFPGNTQDASTVPAKIAQIQNQYGVTELIFVGDRGMITQANSRKLKGVEGLQTISALTHRQIVELLLRKVITPELFDETAIAEVLDPEDLKKRYCLRRNPETAKRETHTRQNLLELTRQKLEAIVQGRSKKRRRKRIQPIRIRRPRPRLARRQRGLRRKRSEHEWAGFCNVTRWANSSSGPRRKANWSGGSIRTKSGPKSVSMVVTWWWPICRSIKWPRPKWWPLTKSSAWSRTPFET